VLQFKEHGVVKVQNSMILLPFGNARQRLYNAEEQGGSEGVTIQKSMKALRQMYVLGRPIRSRQMTSRTAETNKLRTNGMGSNIFVHLYLSCNN